MDNIDENKHISRSVNLFPVGSSDHDVASKLSSVTIKMKKMESSPTVSPACTS